MFQAAAPNLRGPPPGFENVGSRFVDIRFKVLIYLCSGKAKSCEGATPGPSRPHRGHEAGSGPGSSSKTGQYSILPSGFVTKVVMHVQEIIVLRPQLSRSKVHCPQFMTSMNIYLIFSDVCARRWGGNVWTTGTNSELFFQRNGFDFGECG